MKNLNSILRCWLASALSIALLSALSAYAKQLPTDGLVRMNMMINHMLGLVEDSVPPVLDVNWDGELDIADVNGAISAILDGRPVSPVKTLHFNGVPVKMIYVEGTGGDTVTMRAGDRSKRIKVDDFWIAETKATQELWDAVYHIDTVAEMKNENLRIARFIDVEGDTTKKNTIYQWNPGGDENFLGEVLYNNYYDVSSHHKKWDHNLSYTYDRYYYRNDYDKLYECEPTEATTKSVTSYTYNSSERKGEHLPVTNTFTMSLFDRNDATYLGPVRRQNSTINLYSQEYLITPTTHHRCPPLLLCMLLTQAMGEGRPTPVDSDYPYPYELAPERQLRFPSVDEWNYAACGGRFSHGYHYAGSDVKSEVFQELGQEVAQLKPNELGVYDMSSGVYELCGHPNFPETTTICVKFNYELIYQDEYTRKYIYHDSVPRTLLLAMGINNISRSKLTELESDIDNWSANAKKWELQMDAWGVPKLHFMGRNGLLGEEDFISYTYAVYRNLNPVNMLILSSMIPNVAVYGYNKQTYNGDNGALGFRIAVSDLRRGKETDFHMYWGGTAWYTETKFKRAEAESTSYRYGYYNFCRSQPYQLNVISGWR